MAFLVKATKINVILILFGKKGTEIALIIREIKNDDFLLVLKLMPHKMFIITGPGNKIVTFETNFFHDALKIFLRSQERKNLTDTKIMPPAFGTNVVHRAMKKKAVSQSKTCRTWNRRS